MESKRADSLKLENKRLKETIAKLSINSKFKQNAKNHSISSHKYSTSSLDALAKEISGMYPRKISIKGKSRDISPFRKNSKSRKKNDKLMLGILKSRISLKGNIVSNFSKMNSNLNEGIISKKSGFKKQ